MEKEVQKAVEVLKQGGIVIFPTDTAFGIGCRIDNEKAIGRLFKIRKRPINQAVPVLIDTVKMAQDYLLPIPNEVIDKLIELYWPGALTIILPCKTEKVPKLARGGGSTLGVRIPNHPITRKIIQKLGTPILGPSANFSGGKTPFKFGDLNPEIIKMADFVMPGECSVCEQSTVIDCSKKPWKILRRGAIRIQNSKFKIQNYNSKLKEKTTVLIIDTSKRESIKVGLKINGRNYFIEQKTDLQKAQAVLPMIEKILKEQSVNLEDLNEIKIKKGPGSFTGLRVGISVANALSFVLKIPINNKKIGKFVEPVYQ